LRTENGLGYVAGHDKENCVTILIASLTAVATGLAEGEDNTGIPHWPSGNAGEGIRCHDGAGKGKGKQQMPASPPQPAGYRPGWTPAMVLE
jgi:hypothetical protein